MLLDKRCSLACPHCGEDCEPEILGEYKEKLQEMLAHGLEDPIFDVCCTDCSKEFRIYSEASVFIQLVTDDPDQ